MQTGEGNRSAVICPAVSLTVSACRGLWPAWSTAILPASRSHTHIHTCVVLRDCNLQQSVFSSVTVGGKFPWGQGQEKRNKIVLTQPQNASYTTSQSNPVDVREVYSVDVPYAQSQLALSGSITELLVQALGGQPAESPFDAYLNEPKSFCA